MSQDELTVVVELDDVLVQVDELPTVDLTVEETEGIKVIVAGNVGPPGPPGEPGEDGQWVSLTQAEYDGMPIHDPNTLYVIIG